MKKKNLVLLIGAAAIAAFILMRKRSSALRPGEMLDFGPGADDNKEKTDAVIDADKQKISVSDAVNAVVAVSDKIKDLKVEIKKGGSTTTVRTGKKQKAGAGVKTKKPKRTKKTKKTQKAARYLVTETQKQRQAAGLPPFAPVAPSPFFHHSGFPTY